MAESVIPRSEIEHNKPLVSWSTQRFQYIAPTTISFFKHLRCLYVNFNCFQYHFSGCCDIRLQLNIGKSEDIVRLIFLIEDKEHSDDFVSSVWSESRRLEDVFKTSSEDEYERRLQDVFIKTNVCWGVIIQTWRSTLNQF